MSLEFRDIYSDCLVSFDLYLKLCYRHSSGKQEKQKQNKENRIDMNIEPSHHTTNMFLFCTKRIFFQRSLRLLEMWNVFHWIINTTLTFQKNFSSSWKHLNILKYFLNAYVSLDGPKCNKDTYGLCEST